MPKKVFLSSVKIIQEYKEYNFIFFLGIKRWEKLLEKDFHNWEERLRHKCLIPEIGITMLQNYKLKVSEDPKLLPKEKYTKLLLVEKEETIMTKYLGGSVTNASPRLLEEPLWNPIVEYSKSNRLPSFYSLSNYLSASRIILFQPCWFHHFSYFVRANADEWK